MSVVVFRNGKVVNYYNGSQMTGEKIPGDLYSWDTYTTDPNLATINTYETLSKRGLTLYHTSGPIANAVSMNTNYAIGSGLVFRSQPDAEVLGISEKKLKKWAKRFQKLVHYYSESINYYEKQGIIFSTAMQMGDSLAFFVRNPDSSFDIIETGGDQIKWDYTEDNVTLGIMHDEFLRRKGIVKQDLKKISFVNENGDQNLVQFYFKEMARQLRGWPISYKIINITKNNDRLWDATTQRAVLESIMFGTAKTDTVNTQLQAKSLAKANKKNKDISDQNILQRIANVFKLGGGNIFELKRDDNLEFTDLKTPSNNFDKFNDAFIDVVGMASNTPPEVIKMKYSTSFTAHKGALNDFEKAFMRRRKTFIRTMEYPYIREVAKYLILNGFIKAPGFFESPIIQRAWLNGNFLGPVPGHINPLQEVNAQVKAVENAFLKRSDVSERHGNDFDNMIDQWQEEEDRYYQASPEKKAEILANDLQNTSMEGVANE